MPHVLVRDTQMPLRARYKTHPEDAMVEDRAITNGDPGDPFHAVVTPLPRCGESLPVGTHEAVGGPYDAPTPGDILCGALAACQDSSMRMVANLLGVELTRLEVEVTGDVDVRGTLLMDPEVPVGFQEMRVKVRFSVVPGTDASKIDKLVQAAEASCVVLSTLRNSPRMVVDFDES